jgi:L-ascorbate metabolism protein UlaG (beta-lactamase superfamily)
MHLTWLDSNTWLIEFGGQRILLDPWLVGPLVFGNQPWLFQGQRRTPRSIPEHLDLILLSQGLEDHAHPPTLQQLEREIPVVGSPNAAKVVQALGYTRITILEHGETLIWRDRLKIQAVPGSPIGPFLVENGYLLEDLESGIRLYYEPHGYHSPILKDAAPVDVIITPLIDLKLPLLGPIIQGWSSALEVCQWLEPQVILPTAAGGDVEFKGVLNSLLRATGSVAEFRSILTANQLSVQLIEAIPGERFAVDLGQRTASLSH